MATSFARAGCSGQSGITRSRSSRSHANMLRAPWALDNQELRAGNTRNNRRNNCHSATANNERGTTQ
eukprot:1915749-Lingulodinium_polyedra.AAC.1